MKNVYLLTSSLLILANLAISQKVSSEKRRQSITIVYGFGDGPRWWKSEFTSRNIEVPNTDNFYVKYEYALSDKVGIGVDIGFIESWNDEDLFSREEYTHSIRSVRILPMLNYHFYKSKKLDVYCNLETGFYSGRIKITHTHPDPNPLNTLGIPSFGLVKDVILNSKKTGFDYGAGVGLRFLFTNSIAWTCETGINKSLFQTGIVFKF